MLNRLYHVPHNIAINLFYFFVEPGSYVTHTEQNTVWDLCSVSHDGRQLIITTRGPKVVYAYNAASDRCEWTLTDALGETKIKLSSQSIAADANSHLFACDYKNSSIQKFSAIGSYMGVVLKEGSQGLGKPRCVRWCDTLQCLVVAHVKDNCYYVSRIQDDSVDNSQKRFGHSASATKSVDKNISRQKTANAFPQPPAWTCCGRTQCKRK